MNRVLMLLGLTVVHSVDGARRIPSEDCLIPLATDRRPLCPQMESLSKCFGDSKVSRTNAQSLQLSLNAIDRIFKRMDSESCDLNEEFNNECPKDFSTCLDKVTNVRATNNDLTVSCSDDKYADFRQCINRRLPGSLGRCYYSTWLDQIVKRSRTVNCRDGDNVANPSRQAGKSGRVQNSDLLDSVQAPTDSNESQNAISQNSRGNTKRSRSAARKNAPNSVSSSSRTVKSEESYCDAGDIRYYVMDGCTRFQMEWKSRGVLYKIQDVAPGTLFDLNICRLNHKYGVACPI